MPLVINGDRGQTNFKFLLIIFTLLDRVILTLDNTNHHINHYSVDSVVWFANTYPLDGDLFGG